MDKEKVKRINELVDLIGHRLYGISDYCNLSDNHLSSGLISENIKVHEGVNINYSKKEYPLNKIEEWAEEGKKQIDELELLLKTVI